MKITKNKLQITKALMLTAIFAAIAFSLFISSRTHVQAQINPNQDTPFVVGNDLLPGFGRQCMINYASCPTGYSNFMKTLDDGNISLNGVARNNLAQALSDQVLKDDELYKLCISNSLKDIIKVNLRVTDESSLWGGRTDSFSVSDIIYNACYPGTSPSKGPNFLSGGGILQDSPGSWGCCPSGFAFINQRGQSTENQYGLGACCRGAASAFTHFDTTKGCMKDDLVVHDLNNRSIVAQGTTLKNLLDDIAANSQRNILFNNSNGQGPLSVGVPLGKIVYNESKAGRAQTYRDGTRVGSSRICADDLGTGCVYSNAAPPVSGTGFRDPDEMKKPVSQNDQCIRCFARGEAMKIEGDSLLVCDGDGKVLSQALINGNVDDTLAYLRADSANRELLKQCRERGGLYVALGCIDPTPIGILTGLVRIAFGVMGGVALIQLILAGIAYQSGDEGRIKEARERVIATISGLAVLVFSVLILRIIGVNVLDVVPQGSF